MVLLREGDRVPADGVLLSATALSVDESILTGESLPVDKVARQPTRWRRARVYSGSLIVRGFGAAESAATGVALARSARSAARSRRSPTETTPLFPEVRRVVRWVATAGLLLCARIAVIYASTRQDWLGGVLAGITLAMGCLARRVSCRADGLSGDGRVANLARGCADAAHAGCRSDWRSHRARSRQDRHADRKPHARRTDRNRLRMPTTCGKHGRRSTKPLHECLQPRLPPASATRSIRWSARYTKQRASRRRRAARD